MRCCAQEILAYNFNFIQFLLTLMIDKIQTVLNVLNPTHVPFQHINYMTFCILFHTQGNGKVDIEAPVRIVRFVLHLFASLLSLKYLLSYYDYNTKEVFIIGHFKTNFIYFLTNLLAYSNYCLYRKRNAIPRN